MSYGKISGSGMTMQQYGFFLLALLCLLPAKSYSTASDCIEEFRRIYRQLAEDMIRPQPGQVLNLQCIISTSSRGAKIQDASDTVSLMFAPVQTRLINSRISIYCDSAAVYTVDHSEKEISIQPVSYASFREQSGAMANALQDTIFSLGKLNRCSERLLPDKRAGKELILDFDMAARKLIGFQSVSFSIDRKDRQLRNFTIYPVSGRFEKISTDYNGIYYSDGKELQSLETLFFTPDRKLRPEFKDYTLHDLR